MTVPSNGLDLVRMFRLINYLKAPVVVHGITSNPLNTVVRVMRFSMFEASIHLECKLVEWRDINSDRKFCVAKIIEWILI